MARNTKQLRSERAQARAKKRAIQRVALIVVLSLLAAAIIFAVLRNPASDAPTPTPAPTQPAGETSGASGASIDLSAIAALPSSDAPFITTASGLEYQDVVVGTGAEATPGDTVRAHYTGWLVDGSSFDSSRSRGNPFEFPLGAGRVISGWDEGVAGMRVGGQRILVIPASLGYGAAGSGTIPGGATLVFEVELVEVK